MVGCSGGMFSATTGETGFCADSVIFYSELSNCDGSQLCSFVAS
jgi:hypothetical protein